MGWRACGLGLVVGSTWLACTGSDPQPITAAGGAAAGQRLGACLADGTCDAGLACLAGNICLEPTDAGGDQATDGATQEADATPGGEGDAAPDAPRCATTPASCSSTAQSCTNDCRVTYNECKDRCPNDTNLRVCVDTCASSLMACQQPCQGDCAVCANTAGSCTGKADCAAVSYVP